MPEDPYIKNNPDYNTLTQRLEEDFGPVTLPAEYAFFIRDNMMQFLIRLARYKFVARQLSAEDHVLEIGSGTGLGAMFMGQHCRSVTGLEFKENEYEKALSINTRDNVRFMRAEFFEFDTARKFDVVVNLDVIEHMPPEVGERLIAKTAKHLKESGAMVMGTPSIYSYPYQGALSRAAHIKCYDQQELVSIVKKHYGRVLTFSMNDEAVHTGFSKLAWYYFILAFYPKQQ